MGDTLREVDELRVGDEGACELLEEVNEVAENDWLPETALLDEPVRLQEGVLERDDSCDAVRDALDEAVQLVVGEIEGVLVLEADGEGDVLELVDWLDDADAEELCVPLSVNAADAERVGVPDAESGTKMTTRRRRWFLESTCGDGEIKWGDAGRLRNPVRLTCCRITLRLAQHAHNRYHLSSGTTLPPLPYPPFFSRRLRWRQQRPRRCHGGR